MWILPTRSRPNNLRRAIEAYPAVPVQVWFTENDPKIEELTSIELPEAWSYAVAEPDATVPQILNAAFQANPHEQSYGFIGDDVVPPDTRWDLILESAAQNFCMAYPKDSIHGLDLAPHFCLGGDLVRAAEFLAPPWYHHNFLDTTWFVIVANLGLRRAVPDLLFDHQHPLLEAYAEKADEIYAIGQSHYDEDKATFEQFCQGEGLPQLLEKIANKLYALQSNAA